MGDKLIYRFNGYLNDILIKLEKSIKNDGELITIMNKVELAISAKPELVFEEAGSVLLEHGNHILNKNITFFLSFDTSSKKEFGKIMDKLKNKWNTYSPKEQGVFLNIINDMLKTYIEYHFNKYAKSLKKRYFWDMLSQDEKDNLLKEFTS